MKSFKIEELINDMKIGGAAYVRNLAVAENAVIRGQFNLAKVLRAAAHSQRVMAMKIARLYPEKVESALSGIDDEILVRKSFDDQWCVKEVIGHIIETDKAFVQRVETILQSQGVAAIPRSIPPWKLHEGKGYETKSASELVDFLERARKESLGLIKELKPDLWVRKGTILGKTVSILDLGTWLANHDQGHLSRIRNLCNAS